MKEEERVEEFGEFEEVPPVPGKRGPVARLMNFLASLLVLALFAGLTIGLIMYYRSTLFHDDRQRHSTPSPVQQQPVEDAWQAGSGKPASSVPVPVTAVTEAASEMAAPVETVKETVPRTGTDLGGAGQGHSGEAGVAQPLQPPAGQQPGVSLAGSASGKASQSAAEAAPPVAGPAPTAEPGQGSDALPAAEKEAPSAQPPAEVSQSEPPAPALSQPAPETPPAVPEPAASAGSPVTAEPGTTASPVPPRSPAVRQPYYPGWQQPRSRGYPYATPGQQGYGARPGRGYWQGYPYGYPPRR